MKIKFLGTCADDKNLVSDIHSKDYRRNASALIDNCLLVDPGPRVPEALELFGIEASSIKWIINTHSHSDHFSEETLEMLKNSGAELISLSAGEKKCIGDYEVSAYTANHGTCAGAVHFIIDDGSSRIFYGLDGAWLLWDEISAIRENKINLAVLDATIGEAEGDYRIFEHNNLRMIREIKMSLEQHCDRFIISHMAQSLHTDHKTLSDNMAKSGIEVAFDGLELEI